MTWNSKHPVVELVTTAYQTGVKVSKEAMDKLEEQLHRMPLLEKWFIDTRCSSFRAADGGNGALSILYRLA